MAFRRVSSQQDSSIDSTYINSTRTVSSSSSMISTPSNRKAIINNNPNHSNNPNSNHGVNGAVNGNGGKLRASTNLVTKSTKNTKKLNVNLVKNKLLNLQKSSKIYTKKDEILPISKNFIRKPINMNSYDYSVFTNYSINESDLPPCIKESQIKAWESAEKISNNLIFDNDSDLTDEEDNSIIDNEELTVGEGSLAKDKYDLEFIKSIPGYTKEELEIILDRFKIYETATKFSFKGFENEEKQILHKYRQEVQKRQETYFNQYQSLSSKRKIQISQKKSLFNKIFGYLNLLNGEYITNNTSYSSLDNIMNTSKSYQEDKDEINQVLNQDRHFQVNLDEIKAARLCKANEIYETEDFDHNKFQKLISMKLSEIIDNEDLIEDADQEELVNFTMNYLRKCIKHNDEV